MANSTPRTATEIPKRTASRAVGAPRVNHAGMIQTQRTAGDDALRGNVYNALGRLLGSKPSVREALEMKWILLLIITIIRQLSEPAATDLDTWVEDILELGENGGGLRQRTGETIAAFFENAPWGLQKQLDSSPLDTVHTINAIGAGVVSFSRQLAAELDTAKESGVILKDYDVDEAGSEEVDSENEVQTNRRTGNSQRKSKQEKMSPLKAPSSAHNKRSPSTTGPGNHDHGRSIPWTTPEHIGLLELYRDNTDRKVVSHHRIAELHNARFWPKFGEGRTNAAVSQQYLKLVRHDVALIPAKIVELEALLDAAL